MIKEIQKGAYSIGSKQSDPIDDEVARFISTELAATVIDDLQEESEELPEPAQYLLPNIHNVVLEEQEAQIEALHQLGHICPEPLLPNQEAQRIESLNEIDRGNPSGLPEGVTVVEENIPSEKPLNIFALGLAI